MKKKIKILNENIISNINKFTKNDELIRNFLINILNEELSYDRFRDYKKIYKRRIRAYSNKWVPSNEDL